MQRPRKPGRTVKRAKLLRRKLTPPEILLWQQLKGSPAGIRFRKQHPAGDFILDFFCARANLAIEVDGFAHDTGDRPERDAARAAWLLEHRIDTVRIPAAEVFKDAQGVVQSLVSFIEERLRTFGKAPPSAAGAAATSPSQVDGEESEPSLISPAASPGEENDASPTSPSTCDGEGDRDAAGIVVEGPCR